MNMKWKLSPEVVLAPFWQEDDLWGILGSYYFRLYVRYEIDICSRVCYTANSQQNHWKSNLLCEPKAVVGDVEFQKRATTTTLTRRAGWIKPSSTSTSSQLLRRCRQWRRGRQLVGGGPGTGLLDLLGRSILRCPCQPRQNTVQTCSRSSTRPYRHATSGTNRGRSADLQKVFVSEQKRD